MIHESTVQVPNSTGVESERQGDEKDPNTILGVLEEWLEAFEPTSRIKEIERLEQFLRYVRKQRSRGGPDLRKGDTKALFDPAIPDTQERGDHDPNSMLPIPP